MYYHMRRPDARATESNVPIESVRGGLVRNQDGYVYLVRYSRGTPFMSAVTECGKVSASFEIPNLGQIVDLMDPRALGLPARGKVQRIDDRIIKRSRLRAVATPAKAQPA